MAMVQTRTVMIAENSDLAETNNAIHQDTMKRPSEIVSTNLISEDDHQEDNQCKEAKVQGKEEKRESEMAMAHATATSIGGNSALAKTNTAFNQEKVQVPSEIILANPYEGRLFCLPKPFEGRDAALEMTAKGHSSDECKEAEEREKEEKIKVQMTAAQTTSSNENAPQMTKGIPMSEDHSDEKEGKETTTEWREVALTTNPMDGRDIAPHMTSKNRSDAVPDIPPTFFHVPSSETLLSSASLLPPIHALPEPSQEEYANFRDIGAVKRKHIHLLEEAIIKYPSLWIWRDQRFRRPKMIRVGYDILGDMLEFLASTRWRDLNKDKKAEFECLVYELETFGFDIQWLEKSRAMVKQSRFDEKTINRVQKLEAELMEQETEVKVLLNLVQMARAKVNKTKSELGAIRGDIGNFNDFIGF